MPALSDRTILITGATDGLGRGVAERLAGAGATVLLHGRNTVRFEAAASQIVSATGNDRVQTFLADFADLNQVRCMAQAVRDRVPHLHVLINNAGIGSGLPEGRGRQTSSDGYELRFAVNHLAGFLLTLELLPLLHASAPARVVFVASLGQQAIDFADVMLEDGYSGTRAYNQSKLAQIMTCFELASLLPADEVAFTSLHPGTYMPTKMVLEELGTSVDSLEDGIDATVRLAVSPDLDGITGRFYNQQREARANGQAHDARARRRLWDISLELTGANPPSGDGR